MLAYIATRFFMEIAARTPAKAIHSITILSTPFGRAWSAYETTRYDMHSCITRRLVGLYLLLSLVRSAVYTFTLITIF